MANIRTQNGLEWRKPPSNLTCPIRGCGEKLIYVTERHQNGLDGQVAHIWKDSKHKFFCPQEGEDFRVPSRYNRLNRDI